MMRRRVNERNASAQAGTITTPRGASVSQISRSCRQQAHFGSVDDEQRAELRLDGVFEMPAEIGRLGDAPGSAGCPSCMACKVMLSERTASFTGPLRAPRRGRSRSSGPSRTSARSPRSSTSSASTRLASPMKSATNTAGRLLVELARRAVLRDAAVGHHDDAVGDGQRLLLVVRDIDDGEVRASAAARGSPRARGGAAWRRGWTAARRTAAPAAPARARAPPRRAAAGRRTARDGERVLEPGEPDQRQLLRAPARAPSPCGTPLHGRPVGDVLEHRHVREQRVGLEHHADVALGGRAAA